MPEAKPLRFSVESITVGDMEDLEEITGKSFGELMDLLGNAESGGTMSIPIKVLKALVFIIGRQTDPGYTLEQARKVKVTELELVLAEPDPTEAAG
jgi:hypothetical protein